MGLWLLFLVFVLVYEEEPNLILRESSEVIPVLLPGAYPEIYVLSDCSWITHHPEGGQNSAPPEKSGFRKTGLEGPAGG